MVGGQVELPNTILDGEDDDNDADEQCGEDRQERDKHCGTPVDSETGDLAEEFGTAAALGLLIEHRLLIGHGVAPAM